MTIPGVPTKSITSVLAAAFLRTNDPGIAGELWNDNGLVRFSLGQDPTGSWNDGTTWNDSLIWND